MQQHSSQFLIQTNGFDKFKFHMNSQQSGHQTISNFGEPFNLQQVSLIKGKSKTICQQSERSILQNTVAITLRIIGIIIFHLALTWFFDFTFLLYAFFDSLLVLFVFCIKVKGRKLRDIKTRKKLFLITGVILIITIGILGGILAGFFQLSHEEIEYKYPIPDFTKRFYRVDYPLGYYNDEIKEFLDIFRSYRVNNQIITEEQQFYNIVPSKMKVWSSDPMHFDFILQYWKAVEANDHSNNTYIPEYLCIIESDFAVNITFLRQKMEQLLKQDDREILHVEQFWHKETLQKYNFGLLCALKNPSYFTRIWVKLMKTLLDKKYRRIVYLTAFCSIFPYRQVLKWEEYGCSKYQEGDNCQYIHFMPNKKINALNAIKLHKQKLQ